jgi:hypothetical protein
MTHIEPTDNEILRTASQEALTSTETISDDVKRAEIRAALQAALAEKGNIGHDVTSPSEPVALITVQGGKCTYTRSADFSKVSDGEYQLYTHPPVPEPRLADIHVGNWTIEDALREIDCLRAALDSTQTAENAGLAEIERLNEVLMNQRVIAHQQAMSSIQKHTAQMLSEVDYQLLKQWRK